jgi:2-polyprenyl-6-methoxyphenol hydroxylase-like FAD-dependent oxidoreductase
MGKADETSDVVRKTPGAPDGTGHAVVLGAGMAGLAVAKALTAGYDLVTVVDRDQLPSGSDHRRGVPQDRHLHLLLTAGMRALEELFPGLLDELRADGAMISETDRIRICLNGYRLHPARSGHSAIFASRPFLEGRVRRRVREEPGIVLRDRVRVAGLAVNEDGDRVEGIELAGSDGGAPELLPAEVVVDCSGRRSSAPGWLTEMGYRPPEVDELDVQVRYATRRYELPEGALDGDCHVLVGPTPDEPRGGAMTNVEDGTWIVTLFAMAGERVPTDRDAFERFAAQLPIGDIHRAIRAGRTLEDPTRYRFPANRRHRYERLHDFPDGLLIAGDALCTFNPIYGQGMSVAALEAQALQARLRTGTRPSARAWFRETADIIETAWQLAIGSDLAVHAIEGHRTLSIGVLNRYLARLQAAAVDDPRLTAKLIRVLGLVDPPTRLLRPTTIASVVRSALRGAPERRRQAVRERATRTK